MRKRKQRRSMGEAPPLSLTSLMDIVTNILVYTIKIFAVSSITVQDPSVFLPKSTSREDPEDAVVVMVTGTKRQEANNDVAELVTEIPTIVVDGKVIEQLDPTTYRVHPQAKERGYVIKALKQELLEIRRQQNQTAQLTDHDKPAANRQIVIIADKNTPYRVIADVLVTCGEAGFGEFKFAVVKLEA